MHLLNFSYKTASQQTVLIELFGLELYCKVSVKVDLGVSLKFLVFANLESVNCEVNFKVLL